MPTDSEALLKGKKVLITGAAGFIGSHLVQRMIAAGARVRAMAHYRSDPQLHNLEYLSSEERAELEVTRGAIEDGYFVRKAVEGCDLVFHLAALIGIPYSYCAPSSYVAVNVQGTLNVLEACRSEGVSRMIHTSTSECYGTARYTPIDENHPLQGQSPYSATKIGADKLVESYVNSFQLPAVIVRPFNTYGPRQSARAVIPVIIGQLLKGAPVLRLGSLSPVRDLTFVSDTVEGFVRAAVSSSAPGEQVNLGVGKGISIGDLAKRLMRLTGVNVPIETEQQRVRPENSEVLELVSDNRKAGRILDWKPTVTLDEGLQRTIEFVASDVEAGDAEEYRV